MRVAFATCASQPAGREDDLLAARLVDAAIEVWEDPEVDWSAYDRVVIRSTWDYTTNLHRFLEWCALVGPERLRNPPALIGFNSDKLYLHELEVPIVPTAFLGAGDALPETDQELVIKPNISAGGRDTGRFEPQHRDDALALLDKIHASGRTALVQPYLPSVDVDGETAVMFFGGEVSHTLHKKPVLREAGVAPLADMAHAPAAVMLEQDLVTASPATAEELELAHAVHAEIAERFGVPLYLRVDMVAGTQGHPVVMELEAIEPNLYLELKSGAAERLAAAILAS